MFFLVASLAHAGLRDDLAREARGAPQVAIACASARDALARVRAFGGAAPLPSGLGGFLDGLERVVGPESRLGVAWWKTPSVVRLGFDTALDARGLADALARADVAAGLAGTVAVESPDGWRVRDADGAELRVEVTEGWARVTYGTAAPDGETALAAPLRAALPEEPGCGVLLRQMDARIGRTDVVVHLPTAPGTPAAFAATVPGLRDGGAIRLEGAPPVAAATPGVPEAVLVLGVGLQNVDFSTFLDGADLRRARRLQRYLPIPGGTTVALLRSSPTPRVAAVVPFASRIGPRAAVRRAIRLGKEFDFETERLDRTHASLRKEGVELLVAGARGRLMLSTDPSTLNALEAGAGTPWVSEPTRAIAAEWPLLLTFTGLPGPLALLSSTLPRPILLAVDLDEGVIKGLIDLPIPPEQIARLGELLRRAKEARTPPRPRTPDAR